MAEKQVVMSEEQFEKFLAKIGSSGAPPGVTPGVDPMTPDERVKLVVEQMRKGENREAHTIDKIDVVSARTGARFAAIVASSKSDPNGRVLTLEDYVFPDGIEVHRADGGVVPDGMIIKTPKGELTKQYKQWRWTEFYQNDLREYVGKGGDWLRRMKDFGAATQAAEGPR